LTDTVARQKPGLIFKPCRDASWMAISPYRRRSTCLMPTSRFVRLYKGWMVATGTLAELRATFLAFWPSQGFFDLSIDA
jgi:hypothetical protein